MYLGFCHRYRFVQMNLRYNLVRHCAPVTVLNLLRYGTLHVLQSTGTNTRFEYKLVPEGTCCTGTRTVDVSSHSWREMAAVACWRARYDSIRMANQGFWAKVDTMWSAYIKPFVGVFPPSPLLAQLFDWLRAA